MPTCSGVILFAPVPVKRGRALHFLHFSKNVFLLFYNMKFVGSYNLIHFPLDLVHVLVMVSHPSFHCFVSPGSEHVLSVMRNITIYISLLTLS